MRRLLSLAACFLVVAAAGCSLTGNGDDRCNGQSGLFIQTDRDSYRVGDEATLTVENCTGGTLYIDKGYTRPPEYSLEKNVSDMWRLADHGGGGLYIRRVEVEKSKSRNFTLPIDPYKGYVSAMAGTYRYEIDVFYEPKDVGKKFPKEKRLSNTFEIIE